jgi:hypothetical protein
VTPTPDPALDAPTENPHADVIRRLRTTIELCDAGGVS